MPQEISIVIPCFNEHPEILSKTLIDIKQSLSNYVYEIIVIDDCSTKYSYDDVYSQLDDTRVFRHKHNKGYGDSIKTGIMHAKYNWIGITDADSTYPNHLFHMLMQKSEGVEMVVGARSWKDIGWVRRVPKFVLTCYAGYLAEYPIKDLNSGMRIFKKEIAFEFWRLFPNRFSFTSTITLSCLTNGYEVEYIDIDYFKRDGKSNISPIKDTVRFFQLLTKLSLYFNPLRVFFPLSAVVMTAAVMRGLRDYHINGAFGGLTLVLFFMAFQIIFFGLIAQIISKTRNIRY